jgi:DNA-directed RNA polymerase subunit RPC12/RpoP
MSFIDNLICRHEYEEIGRYKKLKCVKCGQEIMVKE